MYIMQTKDVSLDEMWDAIIDYGIKREMIEGRISHHQLWELYISIKNKGKNIKPA